jgi:hypothetical protein
MVQRFKRFKGSTVLVQRFWFTGFNGFNGFNRFKGSQPAGQRTVRGLVAAAARAMGLEALRPPVERAP